MTALLEKTTTVSKLMQGCADSLNTLARRAQVGECSEAEAAKEALPLFEMALESAKDMDDDEQASAMLREFRKHLVPSVLRAWDPWVEEAFPAMQYPPIRWIIAPNLS